MRFRQFGEVLARLRPLDQFVGQRRHRRQQRDSRVLSHALVRIHVGLEVRVVIRTQFVLGDRDRRRNPDRANLELRVLVVERLAHFGAGHARGCTNQPHVRLLVHFFGVARIHRIPVELRLRRVLHPLVVQPGVELAAIVLEVRIVLELRLQELVVGMHLPVLGLLRDQRLVDQPVQDRVHRPVVDHVLGRGRLAEALPLVLGLEKPVVEGLGRDRRRADFCHGIIRSCRASKRESRGARNEKHHGEADKQEDENHPGPAMAVDLIEQHGNDAP